MLRIDPDVAVLMILNFLRLAFPWRLGGDDQRVLNFNCFHKISYICKTKEIEYKSEPAQISSSQTVRKTSSSSSLTTRNDWLNFVPSFVWFLHALASLVLMIRTDGRKLEIGQSSCLSCITICLVFHI